MTADSLIAKFEKVKSKEINNLDKVFMPEYCGKSYIFRFPFPDTIINPGESFIANTGILCNIIKPYCLLVFPHKSITSQSGVKVKDSLQLYQGYHRHIMIDIHNNSNSKFILKYGQAIAKGMIYESPKVNIIN